MKMIPSERLRILVFAQSRNDYITVLLFKMLASIMLTTIMAVLLLSLNEDDVDDDDDEGKHGENDN